MPASDRVVMPSLFQAGGSIHGSAVMTPDAAIRARIYNAALRVQNVSLVNVVGDNLKYW
jgi:hypothetical protein